MKMIADFEQVFGSVDGFHAASNGFDTVLIINQAQCEISHSHLKPRSLFHTITRNIHVDTLSLRYLELRGAERWNT